MERQDERPRAYPEGEARRYEEGAPEEGPAAADADREYSDAESEQRDPRSRPATGTTTPGTSEVPAESRAGDPAERQAATGTGSEFAGTGAAGTPSGYDAAAERKAVAPSDGDAAGAQAGSGASNAAYGADARRGESAVAESRAAGAEREAARADAAAQRPDDTTWRGQAESGAQATPGGVTVAEQPAGLSAEESRTFQQRWESIQGTFIDNPHAATEQADALVGEVMDRLERLRSDYLKDLRQAIGDGSDTEAMRVALTRYRAFFQMLIA